MSEANRLFFALKNSTVIDISLLADSNPFVYYFLDRWQRQALSLLELLPTVETRRSPKKTEFHFLDGQDFKASCIDYKDSFYIGFQISAALRVFDLYIHIINSGKYLLETLPVGPTESKCLEKFSPLKYDQFTLESFPRQAPLSEAHTEAAIRLSFVALEFMLFHELTHLWDGHGPYKQWRERQGRPLSKIELRALEWEADRLSISRMMLMYRAGENIIPLVKQMLVALDGPEGESFFQGTMCSPRTYVRHVVFVLLIFFWHFDEKTDQRYLDKTHPYHSARAFYFLSELGRVLTQWVYNSWAISMDEYLTELSRISMLEAISCWDEMAGQSQASSNLHSAVRQPYALRDLKRFEKVATAIELEIMKNGLRV